MWKGELTTGHERFDPRQLDPLARENLRPANRTPAMGNEQASAFLSKSSSAPIPQRASKFFDGAR